MALYKIRLSLELNPGPDRVYTVTSPDVPELVTEATEEKILAHVQDAIGAMMEIYEEQGWELPPALRPEKAVPIEQMTTLLIAA